MLYVDIGLSLRSNGIPIGTWSKIPPKGRHTLSLSRHDAYECAKRQLQFLQNIGSYPHYAKQVRSPEWTVDADIYQGMEFTKQWETVMLLENVTSVELSQRDEWNSEETMPQETQLFPKVISFSLVGYLTKALAYSVLRQLGPKLTLLRLDNLDFQFEGYDFKHNSNQSYDRFIESLAAQCASLKSLDIVDDYIARWWRQPRYRAYIKLFDSRRTTIENLSLHASLWNNRNVIAAEFRQHLLRQHWPRIYRVEILGEDMTQDALNH